MEYELYAIQDSGIKMDTEESLSENLQSTSRTKTRQVMQNLAPTSIQEWVNKQVEAALPGNSSYDDEVLVSTNDAHSEDASSHSRTEEKS